MDVVSTLIQLVFVGYLFGGGLWKRYKWLTLMLIVGSSRDVWLNRLDPYAWSYDPIWAFTLIPYACTQILCGAGAYFKLARLYRGMGRFAGWLYFSAVLLSELLFLVLHQWQKQDLYHTLVSSSFVLEQSVAISNAGAVLVVAVFLSRFPRPLKRLPRNVVRHLRSLFLYFGLTGSFQIAMSTMTNQSSIQRVQDVFFFLASVWYLCWMLSLRKDGEFGEEWAPLEMRSVSRIRELDRSAIELAMKSSRGIARY